MPDPRLRRPLLGSLAASLLTLGLKAAAYAATGSVGLLADAAESLVNLAAALLALVSLWYAAQPVDRNHAYGHEKVEFFSSGFEGALICFAAAGIAWVALGRLFAPQPLTHIVAGIAVAAVASAINLAAAVWLLRVGRQQRSLILEADGHHLMTDVYSSAAIMVGLALAWATDVPMLDPLLALAMSGMILLTGLRLVRRSFDGLMDHALPDSELEMVRHAIAGTLTAGSQFHAVRSRQAGARRFIDFHLLVPGATSVAGAHAQAVRAEAAIEAALPGVEVVVHIEPVEEQESWGDSAVIPFEP